MRIGIDYGAEHLDVEVPEDRLVPAHREAPAPPLEDPAAAVQEALERPLGFPELRRALTPDDHVAVVVDDRLPHLGSLLAPVLRHITAAGVAPEAITLLCRPGTSQPWLDELPAEFQDVRVEVHDPKDRRHLAYLATTRRGRRIYLNRTAVDADQLVVLARRAYDPLLGYSGSEGALYPTFSDEATRNELWDRLSLAPPGGNPWPVRQEAAEVAWLLGAPFMVQVVEGAGDDLTHVVGGMADTGAEAARLLDERWRVSVDGLADTVVASVSGDPGRVTFADLAQAAVCASRVVKPGGRVVLLSQAAPELGEGAELLRQAETPEEALGLLRKVTPPDMDAAFQWASAAQRATIFLLSEWAADVVEELFAVPLDEAAQVLRLVAGGQSCLFLADAHKTLAVAENAELGASRLRPRETSDHLG